MWDGIKDRLKSVCDACSLYFVLSCMEGRAHRAARVLRKGMWPSLLMSAELYRSSQLLSLSQIEKHKEPLMKCHRTNSPNFTHTFTHTRARTQFRIIVSHRLQNFIPAPLGHCSALFASYLWNHLTLSSRCLIQFCCGNGCRASCAVGWGVPFSCWELSNVIKIHVQLTGNGKCQ